MKMNFMIGTTSFFAEGPFLSTDPLRNEAGVYIILGRHNDFAQWSVVDIGESGDVKTRVSTHDRQDNWKKCGYPTLAAAVIYKITNGIEGRRWVEQSLRQQFNPPCGDR